MHSMHYTVKLNKFEDLYNLFINSEASVNLEAVKQWHLEDLYIEWFTEYFDGRIPTVSQMGYVIAHKWHEFRLHIPFLPLAEFSDTMKELVYDMNYLDATRDLHFPLITKWETLPASWKEFKREVYDYEFPIQVLDNKIIVTKDFRGMFLKEEED